MTLWVCSCGYQYETEGGTLSEKELDMPFECWLKGHKIRK